MVESNASGSRIETALVETQRAWLTHEAERRRLSNARIRAVVEAIDIGGMSHGQVARELSKAGKPFRQKDVSKILACGYPEDEPVSA